MIGDRAVDIVAAKVNGLASIAVQWGHGSREELVAASPDVLLVSPHELLEYADAARNTVLRRFVDPAAGTLENPRRPS